MADLLLSRVAEWWKRWVGEGERRGMLRNGGNCPHRAGAIQRTLSGEDNSACNRIVRDMKLPGLQGLSTPKIVGTVAYLIFPVSLSSTSARVIASIM